jgi:transcriptional regulator with XRE-family HTH domain
MMQGKDLKRVRKALALKQGEFGELLGMSAGYIGELERGEKTIDAKLEAAVKHIAEENEPLRVFVAGMGENYFILLSEKATGGKPGRVHFVLDEPFKNYGAATIQAQIVALNRGGRYVASAIDERI